MVMQVDSIKTRVESAYGFSACIYDMKNRFQRLLSISTFAATPRPTRWLGEAVQVDPIKPTLKPPGTMRLN